MTPKLKNIIFAISILFISILILIPNSLGNGIPALLRLCDADDFPDSENGYTTDESSFTLYIQNKAEQPALILKSQLWFRFYQNLLASLCSIYKLISLINYFHWCF